MVVLSATTAPSPSLLGPSAAVMSLMTPANSASPLLRHKKYSSPFASSRSSRTRSDLRLFSTPSSDETQKLLEAARKMREEAAELEKALGRTVALKEDKTSTPSDSSAVPSAPAPVLKKITLDELANSLSSLPYDSAESAGSTLDSLRDEGVLRLWGSGELGEVFSLTQNRLKQMTGIDGKALNAEQNLEDLKVLLAVSVAGSFVLGISANLGLGALGYPNAGATLSYFIALIPVLVLSIGSSAPGLILAALSAIKTRADSNFDRRRIRHEAAHFLVGYLCGLPIKSYTVRGPTSEVEFYDTTTGDFDSLGRRLTPEEIKPISVVALAGAVGEIGEFGTATGSAQDLDSLGRLMNRVEPYMNGKAQEDQTRWAVQAAQKLLARYQKEYDALIDAFEAKKSVPECIAALEMANRPDQ